MRKKYGKSPDVADAAMLTFYKTIIQLAYNKQKPTRRSALTRSPTNSNQTPFPDRNPFK